MTIKKHMQSKVTNQILIDLNPHTPFPPPLGMSSFFNPWLGLSPAVKSIWTELATEKEKIQQKELGYRL